MDRRSFFRGLLWLAALPLVPIKAIAPIAGKLIATSDMLYWGSGSYATLRFSFEDEPKPTVLGHLSTIAGKVDEAAEEVARWEHLMGIGCNVVQAAVNKTGEVLEKNL